MASFYASGPAGAAGGSNPSVGVNGTTAPASSTEVAGINPSGNLQPLQTDASGYLYVDIAGSAGILNENIAQVNGQTVNVGIGASGTGTQRVAVSSDSSLASIGNITGTVSLPTGASTSALQTTGNTSLASIVSNQTNGTQVTTISGTVPLPTGAATSANQTNGSQKSQLVDSSGNVDSASLQLSSGAVNGAYVLAVAQSGTNFFNSSANSSSVQLASNATFTGTIESAYAQQAFSILMTSDQPITLTLNQYIDAGGTYKVTPLVYNVAANAGFSLSVPVNGNYVNVTAKNTGGSTTTTFNLSVTYGTIASANSLGNTPVSIADVNGVAITGSSVPVSAASLPLPTGAATSALQSSVQGPVAPGTVASNSMLQGVQYNTTLPTLTNTQQSAMQSDSNGRALVNVGASVLPTGAATSANQTTLGSQTTKINDGSNTAAVKAASTAPVAADPALVVSISPNSTTQNQKQVGFAVANAPVYNAYGSTNVTTATYVQLIASTTSATNYLDIFDSSGQAMILGVGPGGSEVIYAYVPPGGDSFSLAIPAGSRVAYKALTANATSGYLLLNLRG